MYYRLNNSCQLVRGALRGAIYDFQSGKVFSINQDALKLLDECRNKSVEDVIDINSPHNKNVLDFMDQLTYTGLGSAYIYKPKNKKQAEPEDEDEKLSFLWIELTSKCNNKCLHCYSSSDACRNDDKVTHDHWMSLISEAHREGAASIQLIGGEPLLYPGWRELVIKANEEGYEFIEIFTNATLIDDSCIEFFKQQKVNVATTIYADNAEVHDKVTLHQGSFRKTMNAVRKILDEGIPLRIASIIMKANENEADNIIKLLEDLGVETTKLDVVRPTGRGDDEELLPERFKIPMIKPPFYTSYEEFWKARKQHNCLAGKIAVTSTGDVIPCIFARNEVCGNILASSLGDILKGSALKRCWSTTKDHVKKCKDCEYRYACYDCRPKAQGSDSSKDWCACTEDCGYDPYTGIWENLDKKE
ncbi:radical SAM protein with 4Fe4S-binding SPASM domain [Ruminiclostridium sufflavum DSM 19573]|uniref:Radical SAM protein with 4Fe4S-binding SPASM domain n=1 Tax=Ruminiclostridium sufflavum DSM 19573 TaxID=1121337 RepID=A0A318XMI9_9FIRM|nr:radical SAM protein [Ruminiclostridium sufflavum]PYG86859.1 radical SAM protein with 4Fe4S-binding SPASM domain [Ruminiclostridium sufflavum DSM 19573]